MARKLKNFEFAKRSRHGKYDWDKWFDGDIWELKRGEDFEHQPADFCATIYTAAMRRGMRVRIHRSPNNDSLVIQAHNGTDD